MNFNKALPWALPQALIWALPLSLLSNLGAAAWARKADLTVLPTNESQGNCPETVVALDMTGVGDANGFTAAILYQGIRKGNPRWTWGGTD